MTHKEESASEPKRTATENEDKLSRDSSVQSGTFASTHKERKRVIKNTVTRATTEKEMKRTEATRRNFKEWNFCYNEMKPGSKRA